MFLTSTKLLLKLYYRPVAAMSGIIDSGSWLFGALLVALLSLLFNFTIAALIYTSYEVRPIPRNLRHHRAVATDQGEQSDDYQEEYRPRQIPQRMPLLGYYGWWLVSFSPTTVLTTVFSLALLYLPTVILLIILFESPGSFGVIIQRDYGPLLACTFMAWSAAHLPAALLGLALLPLKFGAPIALALWLISKLAFAVLMVFAIQTVFGARLGSSIGTVSLAWLSGLLQPCLGYLATPFILLWLYSYLRGDIGDIGSAFRGRQSLKRSLDAATVNPQDAEAHYQLGLIYQQRRQYSEAVARFQRAIEIDKREIDAHFQLGRIAREQGRLQDAINHFDAVVNLDDKHSQSEVWREIGATYEAAGMLDDALVSLSRYFERRPYDPEGLYYYGKTLQRLGRPAEARERLQGCIEAVKTAPYYRRGQLRRWRKLAEELLNAPAK